MFSRSLVLGVLLSSTALSAPAFGADDIEEIIVTATPLERRADELARSVVTLNAEEIARQSAASLGELLAEEPGVAASSFARGASRPIIRGLDTFRIRVLENGSGAHDVSALSEDHGVPIDPLAAQRIEIIRGPAVLRYGSAAVGGAVSVLNNRIPEKATEPLSGSLLAATSPNDDSTEIGMLLDGGGEGYALHADLFSRKAGDYEIPGPDKTQHNTDMDSYGFALGGTAFFDQSDLNGSIGVSWSSFDSQYGVPGGHEGDLGLDLHQDKVQLKSIWNAPSRLWSRVLVEGAWSDYEHDEIDLETGDIGSTFKNKEGEARMEIVHEHVTGFEGAVGVQFRTRDLSAEGEGGELLSPSDMSSWAAYIFETYRMTDATSLEVGGRIERTEVKGVGVEPPSFEGVVLGQDLLDFGKRYNRSFTPVSGSIGLVHNFNIGAVDGITGGITLSYSERAPDILELFAHGGHEATETFEIGLPTAGKEKATSFEIGLRRIESLDYRLSFDVSVYHTTFDGYLYKTDTGFVCGEEFDTCGVDGAPGVEDELRQIHYDQADTEFNGLEGEIAYRAIEWDGGGLTLAGRYDQVSGKYKSGGDLPRMTPRRLGGSVLVEHDGIRAKASLLKVDDQRELASFETPTEGYLNLKVETSYSLESALGTEVEIGLSGSNLLDEEIRNHVSFKKDDVLLPGRMVRLYIRAAF